MSTRHNPILQLKNITKRFGSLPAVDELNLTVFPGEVFGFLGPNGAGKTTTMRIINATKTTAGTAGSGSNTVTSSTNLSYTHKSGLSSSGSGLSSGRSQIVSFMYECMSNRIIIQDEG